MWRTEVDAGYFLSISTLVFKNLIIVCMCVYMWRIEVDAGYFLLIFTLILKILFFVCVCMSVCMSVKLHTCHGGGQPWELALSYFYVGSGAQTQNVRFVW